MSLRSVRSVMPRRSASSRPVCARSCSNENSCSTRSVGGCYDPAMNATAATNLDSIWREVLAESFRALETVTAGVGADQWQLPTPCAEWTVTQVVQHAAGDQLAYAKSLGIG